MLSAYAIRGLFWLAMARRLRQARKKGGAARQPYGYGGHGAQQLGAMATRAGL